MKPSHFQTPRLQRETTYWYGGDPYDDPPRPPNRGGWNVALVLAVLLALSLLK